MLSGRNKYIVAHIDFQNHERFGKLLFDNQKPSIEVLVSNEMFGLDEEHFAGKFAIYDFCFSMCIWTRETTSYCLP